MADNPINNPIRTSRPHTNRVETRVDGKPEESGGPQQPQIERQRFRRAVGTQIATLRVRPVHTQQSRDKAPELKQQDNVEMQSRRQSIGMVGGYRPDVILPQDEPSNIKPPKFYQRLEYFRNYTIRKDPDYEKYKQFPDLHDPKVDPDKADLSMTKRMAMAFLVQYGQMFSAHPDKLELIEKIIDRGSTSAALRFLVYHTKTFDQDVRMNRYFSAYIDERKEHGKYVDQIDRRTPEFYKAQIEFRAKFNPDRSPYNVFRHHN